MYGAFAIGGTEAGGVADGVRAEGEDGTVEEVERRHLRRRYGAEHILDRAPAPGFFCSGSAEWTAEEGGGRSEGVGPSTVEYGLGLRLI